MKIRKPVPEGPTLEERGNAAAATAGAAMSVFELAALDLDLAANEQDEIAHIASNEADRLSAISELADIQSFENRDLASKIRALVA